MLKPLNIPAKAPSSFSITDIRLKKVHVGVIYKIHNPNIIFMQNNSNIFKKTTILLSMYMGTHSLVIDMTF